MIVDWTQKVDENVGGRGFFFVKGTLLVVVVDYSYKFYATYKKTVSCRSVFQPI